MALPSSGAISLNNVNVELGNSGTANINMGSADVRDLFDVASGSITMADGYGASSVIPITRGIFAGGGDVIDYITIQTLGNTTDFGNLTVGRYGSEACADATRGVIAGGYNSRATIDYVTIQTTGNAIDFGDLGYPRQYLGACADATRGVFAGGRNSSNVYVNVLDYVTIQTTGNSTDFGDLSTTSGSGACSDATRACIAVGTTIDYVTIQTTGNGTNFGNTTVNRTSVGISGQ